MDVTRKYDIIKIKGDEKHQIEDLVIIEYPLTIFIDDEEIITLLCTPKSMKELVTGFLHSEGYIDNMDALEHIFIDEAKGRAYVDLKYRRVLNETLMGKRTVTSGCGKGMVFYNVLDSFNAKKIENAPSVSVDDIIKLSREFNRKSELFLSTGGVHSCGLCHKDSILYFEEDIGRHNALDKIIGKALIDGVDLCDKAVITSGRISSEMLIKAAKRGIPAIISRSAPTSLAVDIAKELGVLLIGFARGEKMNIYCDS